MRKGPNPLSLNRMFDKPVGVAAVSSEMICGVDW